MDQNRIHGKTVLITGATSGIGESCAYAFASMGTDLIITGRREENLEELARHIKEQYPVEVIAGNFDVRDREACIRFMDFLNNRPVDILINNAGLSRGLEPADKADFDDWDEMVDTNIKGLLNMTRLIVPGMRSRNKGFILNLGSIAGHDSYPGGSVYCATKHAVAAFTRSLKMDLSGTKVRVGMISPGLVETEFSKVRFHGDEDRAKQVYKGVEPLSAGDVAELIVFMANRPSHVNILDLVVMPVDQSSVFLLSRNEES
ncbi:MAG: SDR family NAD(P)-dependent oxidoreductase [Balneolaceae bacterium]|jgi:3-hydroxy acid dehydrogenase/malonic semialdehyde reductase|nr:MAG: SDR family NAD(P)-dependent oxidoreductase [Balneolaceae bacterium]